MTNRSLCDIIVRMKLFKMNPQYFVTMHETITSDTTFARFNVFTAPENGNINLQNMVGFARLNINNETKQGSLSAMYVAHKHQNKGIGQNLLNYRTEYAQNNGCNHLSVSLQIDKLLEKRRNLFKRNDFTIDYCNAFKDIKPNATPTNIFLPREMSESNLDVRDFDGLEKHIILLSE